MNDTQKQIADLEARMKKLEEMVLPSAGSTSVTRHKKSSAKEFLMTKQAKTDTQKVLALGYFLEHLEGMESFNTSDLEVVFRAAKEKLPANMNDAVNKNIKRGFMDEAKERKDAKKAWYLTSTGENYLENDLNR